MFDQLDLRTGATPWTHHVAKAQVPAGIKRPLAADILIIGAGITGAFLAEIFSRAGKSVVVLDRHQPQTASTMASTALLLWEIDAPLTELADRLGYDRAVEIYRSSFASVQYIVALVDKLKLDCNFVPRASLYLEGTKLSGAAFRKEAELRQKAGLPSMLLAADAVSNLYGFPPRAALRSKGSAEADPVALARDLLNAAISRGAQVIAPANVGNFDFENGKIHACADEGVEVVADTLLLATGYEMPSFVRATRHKIVSTYVICTAPQANAALWPNRDLVWEAENPYLYMRITQDRRVIIGGEDEDIADADRRDALLPQKAKNLQGRLRALLPGADTKPDYAWSAFFGVTEDTLPMIGRVPGLSNVYAAYGYGGNGITFSALAAQILRDEILKTDSGMPADCYALDRD